MESEKDVLGNEIASSNQLVAILFVSAALISGGMLVSTKIKGCKVNEVNSDITFRHEREKKTLDSEMRKKYRAMVFGSKTANLKAVTRSPTMTPILYPRK